MLGNDREHGWRRDPQRQRLGLLEEPRGDRKLKLPEHWQAGGGAGPTAAWTHPTEQLGLPLQRTGSQGERGPSWGAVSMPGLAFGVDRGSQGDRDGAGGTGSLVGRGQGTFLERCGLFEGHDGGGGRGSLSLKEQRKTSISSKPHLLGALLQEALPVLLLVPTSSPGPSLALPDPLPLKCHPIHPLVLPSGL